MKMQWTSAMRVSLCAAALLGASLVQAQTPPPAAAPAEHPHAAPHKPMHKPHHGPKARHHKAPPKHHAGPGHHGSPQEHEAAAVRQVERSGRRPEQHGGETEFQRNALARCSVFKAQEDRHACEQRVRAPGSGTVEGGGILREYTQTVPVAPR